MATLPTPYSRVAGPYIWRVLGIYTAFIVPGLSHTCKLLSQRYNLQLYKPKLSLYLSIRRNKEQYPMCQMPAESGNLLGSDNNPRKQATN